MLSMNLSLAILAEGPYSYANAIGSVGGEGGGEVARGLALTVAQSMLEHELSKSALFDIDAKKGPKATESYALSSPNEVLTSFSELGMSPSRSKLPRWFRR